ncbi:hypothetical protein ACJZ2D_010820 [Fusarium nematophilum]
MPPVNLDRAIFWSPPVAIRQHGAKFEDTDHGPPLRSLGKPNADVVVIFDDNGTSDDDDDDDDDRSTAAYDSGVSGNLISSNDELYANSRPDGRLESPSEVLDHAHGDGFMEALAADLPEYNDDNPVSDDSDASYPDIYEVLGRSEPRLYTPSEMLDLTHTMTPWTGQSSRDWGQADTVNRE